MQVLLPQLYDRVTFLMNDASEISVEIQKQILKIFFALVQVSVFVYFYVYIYVILFTAIITKKTIVLNSQDLANEWFLLLKTLNITL